MDEITQLEESLGTISHGQSAIHERFMGQFAYWIGLVLLAILKQLIQLNGQFGAVDELEEYGAGPTET